MQERLAETLQNSRLESREIEVLATEVLSQEPRRLSQFLFDLLNHEPTEDAVANTLAVFRSLAARNTTWARILEKSVRKKGRCPDPLKQPLRQLIQSQSSQLAPDGRDFRRVLTAFELTEDTSIPVAEEIELKVRRPKSFFQRREIIELPITKSLTLFAELIENTLRHGGSNCRACVCAQVYPKRRKLTTCIVDTGMGIEGSMRTGSNQGLCVRLDRGEAAVRLACDPLVTSKPDKHSGYGLYVASELMIRNSGTLRVFSGNEILTRYRTRWRRMENCRHVPAPWHGTWIAMLVDLDTILPIDDVYTTLPAIPGVEMEDFFE